MKIKNKGRKIYKTKEKNYYGKSSVGKAFSVGLTVLLIGGIGFIGYSVAEPIINYTKKKGDNDVSTIVATDSEQVTNENGEVISGETAADDQSSSFEQYRAYALAPADLLSSDALRTALK